MREGRADGNRIEKGKEACICNRQLRVCGRGGGRHRERGNRGLIDTSEREGYKSDRHLTERGKISDRHLRQGDRWLQRKVKRG